MKKETHVTAAKEHLKIADDYDEKMLKEKEEEKKIGLRTVASQNYFYAGINAIEAVLAGFGSHSFSHENRNRNIAENPSLFSDELYKLYDEVDRDLRNKVAYRGLNGDKYRRVKEFAQKFCELI